MLQSRVAIFCEFDVFDKTTTGGILQPTEQKYHDCNENSHCKEGITHTRDHDVARLDPRPWNPVNNRFNKPWLGIRQRFPQVLDRDTHAMTQRVLEWVTARLRGGGGQQCDYSRVAFRKPGAHMAVTESEVFEPWVEPVWN